MSALLVEFESSGAAARLAVVSGGAVLDSDGLDADASAWAPTISMSWLVGLLALAALVVVVWQYYALGLAAST